MKTTTCVDCGCELSGGLDTFGEPGKEMCQKDYLAYCELATFTRMTPEQRMDWYRMRHGYPVLYVNGRNEAQP